ncbi:F-box/LRR-repeat protein 25-like [Zingiber officinale]|uniref:F-box/LRR-repeat protein 25-like n=1 Tax=Zingiber officinale TaxID=94328 RepID=UPI001C4A7FDA|nr:F-box/LRR-repeat protein 25-like [Zingiber officinale]
MDSRRRRRRQDVQSEDDYLSNLPDELLSHILSFLPTLDSIRTSVLSRRWRHVWTSVPVINFSYFELQPIVKKHFFVSRGGDSVSRLHLSGLSNIHDHGIIVGGRIIAERRINRGHPVYKLIEYVKSHDARHVTLRKFSFEYCSDSLLDLLFDWPSLASLNMQVVGFTNLTLFKFCKFRLSNLNTLSLSLGKNTISNEILANLLSACPILKELQLKADYPQARHESIQIEVPSLLRLTLIPVPSKLQINCEKLEYLRLKADANLMHLHVEAPSLTSVRLYRLWRFGTFAQTICNVTTVAIRVSNKRLLGLTPIFLGKYKAVVQGFPIFHKLIELKIKIYVAEQFSLDIVFDLLRCTPNLQSLILTEYKKPSRDEDLSEWENSSSRINEPLEHLKRVSMNINSERIRSTFLKTLSEIVPAWDRVVVTC